MAVGKANKKVGRPYILEDAAVVYIDSRAARSRLQDASDRRAVINRVIDLGGKTTVGALNESFGYDVRAIVLALNKVNWLGVEVAKSA